MEPMSAYMMRLHFRKPSRVLCEIGKEPCGAVVLKLENDPQSGPVRTQTAGPGPETSGSVGVRGPKHVHH